MTATEQSLVDVLSTGLRIAPGTAITSDTAIFGPKGLGLDSVDVLEIAVLLDKHFGIVIKEESEEVHKALASVGSLAAYVDAHRRA